MYYSSYCSYVKMIVNVQQLLQQVEFLSTGILSTLYKQGHFSLLSKLSYTLSSSVMHSHVLLFVQPKVDKSKEC